MKTHVGHYEIIAELGRGGMGVVYKGYEPSLGRNVAIKELSAALAHDPLVVERFLREARSMAMLNDPHIIQIYSIGQENNQPFFVMEFVDGASVAALINRDSHLRPGDALKIVYQTAQGLGAAHDRGVIHRDVKPGNLVLNQRGQVKIADFGIALANHEVDSKLTSQGELVGTPGYLSPELLLGNPVDERSDVYALGIVLFEMLIGRTPFSEVSVYKLIQAVVETDVADVREFDPSIDSQLAAIVAKMLSKDPEQRYQNMHALIADLDKHPLIVRGGPIEMNIPPARVAVSTMIGVPMPMTPDGSRITPGGSPRVSTPPPEMGRRTPVPPARTTPAPAAAKPMFAESPPALEPEKKSWWPVLIMSALMFLAGATLALHGQIFGAVGSEAPVSASSPPTAEKVAELEQKDTVAAYVEAGIVTLFGLAMTGYWFGIYSRRKRESEAGIHSLAGMKWRECIGLVLEAMRRDGYQEAPSSKQPGEGGTDFLLLHDGESVLLGYKHGTAYRIGESNVREFAHAVQMQGAKSGILVTLGLAEAVARDLSKRYEVEIIDGATLWPKVRPFVPPNTLDHVRLQTSAQAWKGIWMGGACSLVFGVATFFLAEQMSTEENSALVAQVAKSAAHSAAAAPTAGAAQAADLALKQMDASAQAMAAVAKLTDVQLAQRRGEAARQVSSIVQIGSAGWSSESTLLLSLKQSDGADKDLIDEVCRILTQYEELRYTRLQLQPPVNSNAPVRWRQCQ